MRKWMSERLKRRKKTGDETEKNGNKAPEPLQPRFYDDEPSTPATGASVEKSAEVPREAGESVPPVVPAPAQRRGGRSTPAVVRASEAVSEAVPASAGGEGTPRPSRRRRSRGGRGGSRSRAAAPAAVGAASSTAVEGSEAAVAEAPPAEVAPAATAPAGETVAPARASKGTVVLAIGLPGSGKSSWFKRHNIHPLSSDLLRELLFDDAQEQRFQDLVFSNLRSMLKARLIARRPMNYVDATNLTPHDRHSWIKLAKDYGYDVQGLFFDVPLDVCMERHQRRGRAVPEDIMRKMAGKLKAPTFEEGFSKITVVRVKQKDAGGLAEAVPSE